MIEITLRRGDCLDVMKTIPDGTISLILADLPYGTTRNKWDSIIPLDDLWTSYWRVLRKGGAVVLTSAQPFTTMLIASQLKYFKYDLIWRKNKSTGFLNAKKQPLRNHEHVLLFSKDTPPYNPQMTSGHKPGNAATRTKQTTNYGFTGDSSFGGSTLRYPLSVQDFDVVNNDSGERIHPTQKPVSLMSYLIRTYSQPGEIVLDNVMGSGTTGVSCIQEHRDFFGIENDEKYFLLARDRIMKTLAESITK